MMQLLGAIHAFSTNQTMFSQITPWTHIFDQSISGQAMDETHSSERMMKTNYSNKYISKLELGIHHKITCLTLHNYHHFIQLACGMLLHDWAKNTTVYTQ